MYITKFESSGLRNLTDNYINLSPQLNIIDGDNAAGKSSLLEGIGLLISGRSFRTSKNTQLISHNNNKLTLFGEFNDATKMGLSLGYGKDSRKIKLNGDHVDALSKIASIYPVQVLSPESYHLIDSGPNQRRKYIDWLLFHVEHSYKSKWLSFNKVLKQRNSYLRSLKGDIKKLNPLLINTWNSKFIEISKFVTDKRIELVKMIAIDLEVISKELNFDITSIYKIEYMSGTRNYDFSEELKGCITQDVVRGTSTLGPHRADIKISVNGKNVKDVLSRGQKKMLVNALYLAQTNMLKRLTNKDSLFIIDDFSSELDDSNQMKLLSALKKQNGVQVFISCMNAKVLKPMIKEYNSVKMFHVKHGVINEVNLPI